MVYSYPPRAPELHRTGESASMYLLTEVLFQCLKSSGIDHCSFPVNQVSVKPCQMMAYRGAHVEGEDACSEPNIGRLSAPNRSPLLVFRPSNIRGSVVVDRFLL